MTHPYPPDPNPPVPPPAPGPYERTEASAQCMMRDLNDRPVVMGSALYGRPWSDPLSDVEREQMAGLR